MENNPIFEVVVSNNNSVVLQKKIHHIKDKNKSERKEIVASLATATVRFFSRDEYEALKKIEKELLKNLEVKKDTSVIKRLANFLEV